ncbi:toxin-antitoxin system YwqK family antitoxin [Flagellimonas lutimaris]|uniref:toxin-antitoxin system YwqK family antitoxin n=1 Tax=Flagellimonas lutimaris TaxID=475082 RepID=UPI0039C047CC
MKKTFVLTILILITQFGFAQNDKKAVKTSKAVLELIKQKDYTQFFNSFEDTIKARIDEYQKRVGSDYIQKTVDKFNETLSNENIDFHNFNKKVIVPIEGNSKLNYVVYQFPMGSENDGKDYFETSFLIENDFDKIYSVDIVKVQRMPNVKVIHGAEEEEIPEPGEVITENYDDTGFVKKIKYRDFTHLITIDFDKKQNKTRETRFPLDNLTYKSITAYHENGNIRLVANYDNGLVTGNFTKFHENGKIRESGYYSSGLKKDGIWTYFDENGNLTKTEIYENGELISKE